MMMAGFVVALGGMFCFAASQKKQALLIFGTSPVHGWRRLAIIGGTVLLGLSAWLGVSVYGFGVGLVTFFAWACFAAWTVALTASWQRSKK